METRNTPVPIRTWADLEATTRQVLHASEVAALLGVDRRTICRAAERGDLSGRKLGKKWLIARAAVESIALIPERI